MMKIHNISGIYTYGLPYGTNPIYKEAVTMRKQTSYAIEPILEIQKSNSPRDSTKDKGKFIDVYF